MDVLASDGTAAPAGPGHTPDQQVATAPPLAVEFSTHEQGAAVTTAHASQATPPLTDETAARPGGSHEVDTSAPGPPTQAPMAPEAPEDPITTGPSEVARAAPPAVSVDTMPPDTHDPTGATTGDVRPDAEMSDIEYEDEISDDGTAPVTAKVPRKQIESASSPPCIDVLPSDIHCHQPPPVQSMQAPLSLLL